MANAIFKTFNLKLLLVCFLYTQLEGATISRSFEFDLGGNLKKVTTSDNCSIAYEYDQLQQLSKVTDSQGRVFQYQYDANGNCLQIEDEHGITKYGYEKAKRIVSVFHRRSDKTLIARKILLTREKWLSGIADEGYIHIILDFQEI